MINGIEDKLNSKNIKPTAMRQLVLQVLTDQKIAISQRELEKNLQMLTKQPSTES